MESDELQGSSWADMAPDLLANIFARLTLQQLLVIVPSVCKPWQLASRSPLCYLSLDLRGFSTFRIERLFEQIILPRSQGRLLHIFISSVQNLSSMYLLIKSAPLLQTLHIPSCYVDDEWAAFAAPFMRHIVDLNLNRCSNKLSHLAIEVLGKSGRHVLKLRRNHLWSENPAVSDDEALAIAHNYPFIKHLELQSNTLSEQGLKAILLHCPDLEHLDLAGCVHLRDMDSSLLDQCYAQIKDFREPTISADDEPSDDDGYFFTDFDVSSNDADYFEDFHDFHDYFGSGRMWY